MQQGQHVGPDGVQLLVEFVAQRVDAVQTIGHRLGVTGIERDQQALDFGVEMTPGIAHCGIDAAFETTERSRAAERCSFLDQSVDQPARGLCLPLDLQALGFEDAADVRKSGTTGWRLHFFDDHPAKRQRPLQGADIRPRQVAVGRDVAVRQLLEAVADLHDRHHRKNGRNRH